MAIAVKTNQITGPGATGSFASTDPGFQPKALISWQGLQTATGAAASAEFGLGFATGSGTDRSAGYNSLDASASSDVVRVLSTSAIIRMLTPGATTANVVGSLTSLDATGFTLNFATLVTTSPLLNYLAIGGADVTNVFSSSVALNTVTGNQAITGVGFQPDVVILFSQLLTAGGQTNANSCYGFGVATSSSARWTTGVGMNNASATMNNRRFFYDNKCLVLSQAGANAEEFAADLVSMDSGGFTINISTAPGSAWIMGYLCIKGGQWKAGSFTQKTTTGTDTISGVGFTPSGALFATVCDTTNNAIVDNARLCIGASTGPTNNVAVWTGDSDNVADSIADTIMSATKCIVMATEGTPTTNAEADLDSFNSDGFVLDWTTADATARDIGYLAFGDNAGGGGGNSYPNWPDFQNQGFWSPRFN